MPTHVTTLIVDLDKHRKTLAATKKTQLNSVKQRNELRALAETYFQEIRPTVSQVPGQEETVRSIDTEMQELVELCHKRGSVARYLAILRQAKGYLISLDTSLVSAGPQNGPVLKTDPIDHQIVVTLRALLPSAAISYEQALIDLAQTERLSWRGPATDLREALRETLDFLAPDKEVEQSPGFKLSSGTSRPTMKQKVRYVLRNRGTSKTIAAPSEDAAEAVEQAIGQFVRSVYNRSSVSTHTPTDRAEVSRVHAFVRVVLSELLELER